jgi:hypothetical protein
MIVYRPLPDWSTPKMKNLNYKSLIILTAMSSSVVASAFATASLARQASLNVGLIHEWKFNGNGADSIGDSTVVPFGPVSYTDAVMGEGIVLNGSNTGVNLPITKEMQFEGSFTISAWAMLKSKPSSGKMWSSIIFNGDDRAGLDPYALQVGPDGKMVFLTTGAHSESSVSAPLPLNKFVLVTGVYEKNSGTQTLYLDGKQVSQATGKSELTPVVPLVENELPGIGIGVNNEFRKSRYHFGWDGIINDLRIYNRSLSASEVQNLFKLGVNQAKQTGLDVIHQ